MVILTSASEWGIVKGCASVLMCIQVAPVEKFSENSGLGISLDVCAGRHILCSVLPEGPVGRSGKICSGDELIEVKHIHRKQHTTNMHQKI